MVHTWYTRYTLAVIRGTRCCNHGPGTLHRWRDDSSYSHTLDDSSKKEGSTTGGWPYYLGGLLVVVVEVRVFVGFALLFFLDEATFDNVLFVLTVITDDYKL